MKTKIRLDVLNLSMTNWAKVNKICFDRFQIEVTPKELIDLIGFEGGTFLSGKLNEKEREFVSNYYKLGRELTTK